MSSRVCRCGGCGGPLSEAANEQGTVACSFCGMVNEVTAPTPQPIVIRVDAGRQILRPGGGVAFAISTTIFAMVIGAGFVAYRAVRPASGALDIVRREALRAREATRPLALTELPTLKERGHRPVNAPPPPGGWTTFDPVAGVPWANEIARAWAPDARLTRIDLGLISGDGTADLVLPESVTPRRHPTRPRPRRGRLSVAMIGGGQADGRHNHTGNAPMSETQQKPRFGSELFEATNLKALNHDINEWLNTYGHRITVIGFSHASHVRNDLHREYSCIIAWRQDP